MRKLIIEIVALLFILLFVYAAVNKLLDFENFKAQIGQSPLLTIFADWIVWIIPVVELTLSIFLTIDRFRLLAFYGCFCLMVMFSGYIIAILNFSIYVPCSCGGVLERLGWTEHLVFNIGFVLLAMLGIILLSKSDNKKQSNVNLNSLTNFS